MALVSVCFVCLGNICRSPTAEGVFHALLEAEGLLDKVRIDSAGTAAYHVGEGADARSRAFARKRGYKLESIARQFEARDFGVFDYVLAMDLQNLRDLQDLAKRSQHPPKHLSLLRDFDPSAGPGAGVPDPYFGGDRGFEEVLDQCERACRGLIEHLRENRML